MVNKFKMINSVLGWLVFAIAAFTYISCIEPTASFWDCGEYIACSYKLEVGHPPGAPTFLLLGRFFSLFASDPSHVAACVNVMSALASAGTILFMFWSMTMLGKKLVSAMGDELTDGRMWAVIGSAAVGSLAYTFSDSFWFSAVEGEVYGMSSFFTAMVFWAILRWDAEEDSRADRWIVFIGYMIGLSIGVHLLNLLTIPSIVMIVYFKKFEHNRKNFIYAGLAAIGLLGVVQNGIIPGIVSAAANYELLFVNTVGLPFNYGTIIYFGLLIAMLVTGIRYTRLGGAQRYKYFTYVGGAFFFLSVVGAMLYGKWLLPLLTFGAAAFLIYKLKENRVVLNTILLSFTVLLIGYSSFFVLVIRSKANTPMDENNPENAISLLSYLNREQYGDWPIAYGPYYNAPIDPDDQASDGSPVYAQDAATGTYVISDARKQSVYNFAPEMCTFFPRMWDMSQKSHVAQYEAWGDVKNNKTKVKVKSRYREGEYETYDCPTFTANLKYFWNYQLEFMYWRYFMWNFVGRQNDIQGNGNITEGNWQSGLGGGDVDPKIVPKHMQENKANNKFYYIPLLLGLFGMWFHFSKDWKSALVVMLLFLFTGLAIVIYLNQYPQQPRERDYAYAGSFYAFAFWIGFAVYGIYDLLTKYAKAPQTAAAGLATVMCLTAPYLMGAQGWDDHNRSNRYTCRDFAENYLTSCAQNAILFTNGDNDTFPLWYAQEVEGYRTDMRVLNLSLLNTGWYIDQANRKAYDSDRLPFSLPRSRYRDGSCDQVIFSDKCADEKGKVKQGPLMSLKSVIDLVAAKDPSVLQIDRMQDDNGEGYSDTTFVLPTNHFYIDVDKALVKANGTVPADTPDSLIQSKVEFTVMKRYMYKADLMILDLIANNNWKRPIYFAVTAGTDSYMNLENNFRLEGLTYRLVPMTRSQHGIFNEPLGCNTQLMYDRVMGNGTKEFPGFKFGGLDALGKKIYMDENNLRFTTNQRLQMMTLAKVLNDEGKKDMAKKVLDKCMLMMPREHVPYETALVYMVDIYYKCDGFTEGSKLANDLFDQMTEDYKFYSTLAAKQSAGDDFDTEAQRLAAGLRMLYQYAKDNKQTEQMATLKKKLDDLKIPVEEEPAFPQQQQQFDPTTIDPSHMSKDQMDSFMKAMGIDTGKP